MHSGWQRLLWRSEPVINNEFSSIFTSVMNNDRHYLPVIVHGDTSDRKYFRITKSQSQIWGGWLYSF